MAISVTTHTEITFDYRGEPAGRIVINTPQRQLTIWLHDTDQGEAVTVDVWSLTEGRKLDHYAHFKF